MKITIGNQGGANWLRVYRGRPNADCQPRDPQWALVGKMEIPVGTRARYASTWWRSLKTLRADAAYHGLRLVTLGAPKKTGAPAKYI